MFDYKDPSVDPARCDALSVESREFTCLACENIEQDDEFFPFCSASCARQADGESDEDEPNPRERGDDDGVEYSDPRDAREGRYDRD